MLVNFTNLKGLFRGRYEIEESE